MNINTDTLSDLIRIFGEQELHIQQNNKEENRVENENNITKAYNNIIRHTLPYWDSNDKKQLAQIRETLSNIYYRTKEILQALNSNIELPTNLTKEIIVEQKPTIDIEQNTTKEDTKEKPEDLLTSKLEYDEETLQTLIDNFNEWDRKITRKNASEKQEILEYRTQKIIDAYNNLIDFSKPIIKNSDDETKQDIENKLQTIRDNIIDDLKILNANINVPEDLTKKIENTFSNNDKKSNNTSHSEDQRPNNDKRKSDKTKNPNSNKSNTKNVMAETNFAYLSSISRIINNTYKGDPNGLQAFIAAIELADASSTPEQQEILVKFIKTKLEGKALEALPEDVLTANEIIRALREKIKPDTSKVVIGRLLALRAERNALQKFQQQAEDLADQLRRAYISEGMTHHLAEKTTIDKTVDMCRLSAKTNLVKSVLASTHFNSPKEVLAKLVTETTTENSEPQVLYYRQRDGQRGRNFNNNFNNRNPRQNYRQNNDNRGNFNQHRGNFRGNFRYNGRGQGNRRFFNRNNNQNGNNGNFRNSRHVRIISEENGESPTPQRGQTVTLSELQN